MTTSKPSTRRPTEDAGLFPLECLASRPVAPGSSEARQITAGSGRTLSGCLLPSDPLGGFSRILLGLETWASPEFYLTWKHKATQCGCLVFQLAPSAPRTDGNGIGLSAEGWPTPDSQMASGGRQSKTPGATYRDNGTKRQTTLNELATWPTPDASEAGKTSRGGDRVSEPLIGGMIRGTWGSSRQTDAKCGHSYTDGMTGKDLSKDLTLATWPTPRSEDSESTGAHRGTPDTLTSATRAAWATPKKSEAGPDFAIANRPDSGGTSLPTQATGKISSGCLARTEKFVERLMTLSAWLMGYTEAYLRPWATASCRKSRQKSSKP